MDTSTENINDNHGSIFDELQSPVGGSLFDSDSESSEDEELEPGSWNICSVNHSEHFSYKIY